MIENNFSTYHISDISKHKYEIKNNKFKVGQYWTSLANKTSNFKIYLSLDFWRNTFEYT